MNSKVNEYLNDVVLLSQGVANYATALQEDGNADNVDSTRYLIGLMQSNLMELQRKIELVKDLSKL